MAVPPTRAPLPMVAGSPRWGCSRRIRSTTVSPGVLLGPADGSRPPVALAPDLDRPTGNWVDTDLNGWMVDSRPGPAWDGNGRVVAVVTDRGRSHPWVFGFDGASGRPTGGWRLVDGDLDGRFAGHRDDGAGVVARDARRSRDGAGHARRRRRPGPDADDDRLGLAARHALARARNASMMRTTFLCGLMRPA